MAKLEEPACFFAVSFNIAAFPHFGGGAIFRLIDTDGQSTRVILMRESLTHLVKEGNKILEENFSGWEEKERKGDEKKAYEQAVRQFHSLKPEMNEDDFGNFLASEIKNAFKFDSLGDLCEFSTHAQDGSYQNILMWPITLRPFIEKSETVLGMFRANSN
jgi:hypothetical protein